MVKLEKNEIEKFKQLYKNKSAKYFIKSETENYTKQYFHLYLYRLNEVTKILKNKLKDTKFPIKKLCDLREDGNEKCILIGTLFKHQVLKPSILRELCEEAQVPPQPIQQNYVSESDKLFLEDELQRIRLVGDEINVHNFVTGVVCAVLGSVDTNGRFIVEEFIFYESGPQKSLSTLESSPYIVLISGLNLSDVEETSLESFKQWALGNKSEFGNEVPNLSNIVRIIVAGNSIRAFSPRKQQPTLQICKSEFHSDPMTGVIELDELCLELCKNIPVDIMPGEFDPTNFLLPQEPLHPFMFPKSFKSENLKSVPNPYGFEIADRYILGTSGQNVKDIIAISKIEDPIEVLRSTLIWSHITPTSPDTLACYPYRDTDPFIIEECPHIYFAGNQTKFKTDLYRGKDNKVCRLISIPSFAQTQSIAVVNLNTLDCYQICFEQE